MHVFVDSYNDLIMTLSKKNFRHWYTPPPLFDLKIVYSYVIEVADSESYLGLHGRALVSEIFAFYHFEGVCRVSTFEGVCRYLLLRVYVGIYFWGCMYVVYLLVLIYVGYFLWGCINRCIFSNSSAKRSFNWKIHVTLIRRNTIISETRALPCKPRSDSEPASSIT